MMKITIRQFNREGFYPSHLVRRKAVTERAAPDKLHDLRS